MFFIDINVLFFSYTFVNSHFTAEGSHLVINLRSIIALITQQKGSKMYTSMAGTSNLNMEQPLNLVFSKTVSVPFGI